MFCCPPPPAQRHPAAIAYPKPWKRWSIQDTKPLLMVMLRAQGGPIVWSDQHPVQRIAIGPPGEEVQRGVSVAGGDEARPGRQGAAGRSGAAAGISEQTL